MNEIIQANIAPNITIAAQSGPSTISMPSASTVYTTANTNPWSGTYIATNSNWGGGVGGVVGGSVSYDDKVTISGDLIVKGVNILDIVEKIQDRLSILVPDPVLLEKYEALREAYEHYKTLEALCRPETNNNDK